MPGTGRLNQGDNAWLNQISCSSAGNCGAVGYYSAADDFGFIYAQPFVINQVRGTWAKAIEVPGIKTLSIRTGQVDATTTISCTAPDRCSAGWYYQDPEGHEHAIVDSRP